MPRPIFTIGHSTRPIAEFLEILQVHAICQLVDVRTGPGSRRNPIAVVEADEVHYPAPEASQLEL